MSICHALSPDDSGFALAQYASQIVGNRNRVILMLDWIDRRMAVRSADRAGAALPDTPLP